MGARTAGDMNRPSRVAYLILASLAGGPKHGYALTKDVESFTGVRIAPGSLYEALARLEVQGLIEPIDSVDRRRPYRLTANGAAVLDEHLRAQEAIMTEGRRRLRQSWELA